MPAKYRVNEVNVVRAVGGLIEKSFGETTHVGTLLESQLATLLSSDKAFHATLSEAAVLQCTVAMPVTVYPLAHENVAEDPVPVA